MTITAPAPRSLVALVAAAVLVLTGLTGPAKGSVAGAAAPPGQPAHPRGAACADADPPYDVGTTRIRVRSRGNSLATTVAYPATSEGEGATPVCKKSRLVVAGHGAEGNGASAASIHRYLVQRGYVVAAPTFPDGFDFDGYTTDVSRTITKVRRLSREGVGVLAHLLARNSHVGYIGTSMGGMIGLALVDKDGRDDRINAVVSKAGRFPGSSELQGKGGPPLLMINGNDDTVISYPAALEDYREAKRPKGFITLDGVGHDLNTGGDPILTRSSLGFFARFLRGRAAGLKEVVDAVEDSDIASLRHRW